MTNQLRSPNFKSGGKLFLVRCFACDPIYGLENYAPSVASGQCSFCGWKEEPNEQREKLKQEESN